MNSKQYADIVIHSNAIFTGCDDSVFSGFIAIKENKIVTVGEKGEMTAWIGPNTVFYDFDNQLVMPGIHDDHVFFTGYMSMHRGVDLTKTTTIKEALQLLKAYEKNLREGENLYGYGWHQDDWGCEPDRKLLDESFPNRAVIAINKTKSYCWMNQCAIDKYGFTPENCSAEARALLLKEMLSDRNRITKEFKDFCSLLVSKGVTSIKDIGFDEYLLLPILEELNDKGELPLRVHFILQGVRKPLNIELGLKYKRKYKNDCIRYQGFKIMVDGVVADHTGDMLETYQDMPETTGLLPIDYDQIKEIVRKADQVGLKCCLTAEGDAAIRKAVDIFAACIEYNGKKDLRHSISDLEYPHPDDLKRMGELGIYAEIYPQVLLLNPSYEKSYMAERVGKAKENRFYNYHAMIDAGITVTAGTDLPLFITDIPESIYSASKRLFPDGTPDNGFYPENGISVADLLKAWTINGAKHNFMEDKTGTIEVGKYADIAVFNQNLLNSTAKELHQAEVILTISNGVIVYDITK